MRGHGTSKSAVNRKAIAITAQAVEAFYNRKLDTLELVVILIDGIQVGEVNSIVCGHRFRRPQARVGHSNPGAGGFGELLGSVVSVR